MRTLSFLVVSGLVALSSATARAKATDLRVCIDVAVQRPIPKKKPALAPRTAAPASVSPRAALEPQAAEREQNVDLDPAASQDQRVRSGAHLPLGQTPEAYLKRLLEHFVTHERGYVAVPAGCSQRIIVDLYPLRVGWTAFARYSGTGREERVDQLLPTELAQFAERSVLALLRDTSINETVDRGNVLWADSLKSSQTIRGRGHVILGVGTRVRAARLPTVVRDAASPDFGQTTPTFRLLTPMLMTIGYRGQFEEFGVQAEGQLDLGTSQVAARRNPVGGHVDFGGSTGVALHAVRYANVRGLTSLYYGAGASFLLHWFSVVRPEPERGGDSRSSLLGGGLDVDLVVGYEFMRASAISFYLQGELNVPAYVIRSENNHGSVNTWFPGAALKLGASF